MTSMPTFLLASEAVLPASGCNPLSTAHALVLLGRARRRASHIADRILQMSHSENASRLPVLRNFLIELEGYIDHLEHVICDTEF